MRRRIQNQFLGGYIGVLAHIPRSCSDGGDERRIGRSRLFTHVKAGEMAEKKRTFGVYLDGAPSNAGGIVKCDVKTEHLSRPVHHHCLELRTCWAGGPLPVITNGTRISNQDKGEGKLQCEHEREWTTQEDGDRAHIESGVGSDTICVQIPEDGWKGAGGGKVGKEAWVLPVRQALIFISVSRRSSLDGEKRGSSVDTYRGQ